MKRIPILLLAASVLAASLAACGSPAASSSSAPPSSAPSSAAQGYTFTDDLGRTVTVEQPERAATLIGSFADVWRLAGGQDTLAAAAHDAWTSFDLGLSETVADLGAVKEPNLEVLLAAQPDFILASCNTTADLELESTFENAGIPDGSAPTVLTIRATGSSCKVKGSQDFLLGEMLSDLGCVNVADSNASLLEELSLEAILAADPDYIFVVLQGSDATDAQETLEKTLLSNPAWGGRFHTLEHSLYNLKPNARWGEAYEKLADILYP